MHLNQFNNSAFDRGRPIIVEAMWLLLQALFVSSFLPGSLMRIWLLRLFGAEIGRNVVVKPGVRIKFPWFLKVGDFTWLGEDVWIDNLAPVNIGSHCCISQGVYLCTGSHNWKKDSFDLITLPITINNHVWLCARSTVGPGITVGEGAVLSLGSTAYHDLDPWWIYQGTPAVKTEKRHSKG